MASQNPPIFKGIATALVTPFKNGSIDFNSMAKLIDFQLENNVSAIVICGTTGEAPTLSETEQSSLIEFAVKRVNGSIPVIAGSGSNCTKKAVDLSIRAENLGADALLIVTPYYNKASDEGLIRHYITIADSVSIPIILYNVPSRTGIDISPEVYETLSTHDHIIGLKEAGKNVNTIKKLKAKKIPLQIFSGNDQGTCDLLSLGALGCISVASNIIPREMIQICNYFFSGEIQKAFELESLMTPLFNELFCEVNPIPVKYAMKLMGLCDGEMRLPLCPPSEHSCIAIENSLKKFNLI